MAAKKKKKDDGLKNFIISYTTQYSTSTLTYTQRAIDKHDAILKFKQLTPGIKIKDVKEEVKQPEPNIGRGLSASHLYIDDVGKNGSYIIGVDLGKDEKTNQEGKIE